MWACGVDKICCWIQSSNHFVQCPKFDALRYSVVVPGGVCYYVCVRPYQSLKNIVRKHHHYSVQHKLAARTVLNLMAYENTAPDGMMSSVSWEGGCDRLGSRWGVIGTMKEEKQKRWGGDKLYKQADGKKKHRWDREGQDKHWKMVRLKKKRKEIDAGGRIHLPSTLRFHLNPLFLQ